MCRWAACWRFSFGAHYTLGIRFANRSQLHLRAAVLLLHPPLTLRNSDPVQKSFWTMGRSCQGAPVGLLRATDFVALLRTLHLQHGQMYGAAAMIYSPGHAVLIEGSGHKPERRTQLQLNAGQARCA